jgi:hypothetical protein
MYVKLKDVLEKAKQEYHDSNSRKAFKKRTENVTPNDISIMLQYAILGLNATQIESKMNCKFTRETISRHLQPYKLTRRKMNEPLVSEYLKNFDTSYAAGIEA